MLTGLALCGVCDDGTTVHAGGSAKAGQRNYRCSGGACFARRAEPVEQDVRAVMVARLSRPDAAELLVQSDLPDLDALRVQAEGYRAAPGCPGSATNKVPCYLVIRWRGAFACDHVPVGVEEGQTLAHAVSLHYMHYNFARPHKTQTRPTRATPPPRRWPLAWPITSGPSRRSLRCWTRAR